VDRINPVLEALDSHLAGLEVDVLPLDVGELTDPEPVMKRHQDHALVPILVTGALAQRLADRFDFRRRQVAFAPELVVGLPRASDFPRFSEFCLLGTEGNGLICHGTGLITINLMYSIHRSSRVGAEQKLSDSTQLMEGLTMQRCLPWILAAVCLVAGWETQASEKDWTKESP
jgi:hypothetical protein